MSDNQHSAINQAQPPKIQAESDQPPPEQRTVQQLLLENQEMLGEVMAEGRYRRNKNVITPKMMVLLGRIERNIIRMAKKLPPEALVDTQHVRMEKERFLRFYQKRNSAKKPGQGGQVKTPKEQSG